MILRIRIIVNRKIRIFLRKATILRKNSKNKNLCEYRPGIVPNFDKPLLWHWLSKRIDRETCEMKLNCVKIFVCLHIGFFLFLRYCIFILVAINASLQKSGCYLIIPTSQVDHGISKWIQLCKIFLSPRSLIMQTLNADVFF